MVGQLETLLREVADMEMRAKIANAMALRAASLDDLEAILALERAVFLLDPLSRRALRRFLAKPIRPAIVAGFGARLAGYVLMSFRDSARACRIYSLAVAPDQTRRGVGRELLHAAGRYARAHGFDALRLEARYDNVAALAFYEKEGFRPFGRYPGYYLDGAEALRFEKRLDSARH